jgi:hypothetical protein
VISDLGGPSSATTSGSNSGTTSSYPPPNTPVDSAEFRSYLTSGQGALTQAQADCAIKKAKALGLKTAGEVKKTQASFRECG